MSAQAPVDLYIHPKFLPLINAPHTIADIHGGRYGMKCLGRGTLILMADATLKPVEQIQEGDFVMGPSGPRVVTEFRSGYGELYRVSQQSGVEYVVTGNHLLALKQSGASKRAGRYPGSGEVTLVEAEAYCRKTRRWRKHFRGFKQPLQWPECPVSIDPYLLGVWLGDGHSLSPRVYSADEEIIQWLQDYSRANGYDSTIQQEPSRCSCVVLHSGSRGYDNPLWAKFRMLGLSGNKHIPNSYQRNSDSVRLQLLAGILDTDGCYYSGRNRYQFENTNARLANDVKLLADTLGFTTTISHKATRASNGAIGEAWSVYIRGDIWRIPCKIKRKQAPAAPSPRKEFGLSELIVEPIGFGEWYGFSLDGDKLFCLADGTVTHNTETVWRIALMRAMNEPLRCLGARETLASIKDSSHKTISDIIYSSEMAVSQGGPFEIQSDRIIRRDPEDPQRIISEFFYAGVRESIRDKKSLAGIDLVVFDEAGKVSQDTLDVFLPTIIRKTGCKAWFIWNPESTADPIWKWFNVGKPSNCLTIETDYRDNPWLSAEAQRLVEDCRRDDPEKYEHLYLGKPQSAISGAIFGGEYKTAVADGRIGVIPYNRTKPVHTAWDLGMDRTVIWFVQAYDGHLWFIDYYANQDQEISHYLVELQRRPYVYGAMHLPHDAVNTVVHRRGLMGKNPNLSESPQSMMREADFNVVVGPTNLKRERIDAARRKWPVCRFDHAKCAEGLEGLKSYQWDRDLSDNGERKPLHNWASHPADAFMEACINVKERIKRPLPVAHSGMAVADI
jgi:hypothetical protein